MAASDTPIPPLTRTITVPWSQEASFRRFTAEIAAWWPIRSHSVGQERAQEVIFEGRQGGRIYERMTNGDQSTWGTVLLWSPPGKVRFTWHPGHGPERATEVEVSFEPVPGGTRLTLVHACWERLGTDAKRARRAYPLGWSYVLALWAGRAGSLLVRSVDALMWVLGPLQRRAARKLAAEAPIERAGPG